MNEDNRNNTSEAIPAVQIAQTQRPPGSGKQKFVVLLLLLLALMVVFLLPEFVTEPWIVSNDTAAPAVPDSGPSAVSPSTAAEKTKYRQDAQKILAEIITKRDQLLGQQVESWAGIEFRQALKHIETGDDQYGYGDYKASMSSYERGLEQLNALLKQGQDKLSQALADGFQAVEKLNTAAAVEAADLASLIAPDDARVKQLSARAATLPKVAEFVGAGDRAMEARELARAKSAYQAAAEADPAHKRAARALADVNKVIVESRFRTHMSAGYAALDNNQFDQARSEFLEAGAIFKGDKSVEQALALVANREGQVGISRQIEQAADFEAREEWQKAVQIYESLLQQDPSLAEVKVKLIPARVRSELEERMSAIISDPLKLSASAAYRNAQQVLSDARGIPNPGQRLRGQIDSVEKLLQAALSSVNVVFQSDNQTDVTVYRVARLGQFEETTLQLKPGRYIAAGTRQGFRDVRVEFVITGAPPDSPIVIRCEEPI